jgi:hypothetical protein
MFLFLLDRLPAQRSSGLLLDFVKVIITVIICVAAVIDLQLSDTLRTKQRWRRDGPALIGQSGKETPYIMIQVFRTKSTTLKKITVSALW